MFFKYFSFYTICRAVASMGQGGQLSPNLGRYPPPQSGLAPATVVSLRLAMGHLRLEKCIKTKINSVKVI